MTAVDLMSRNRLPMCDWSDGLETDITNIDAHDGDPATMTALMTAEIEQSARKSAWRKAYLNTLSPSNCTTATVPPATAHHPGHHDYGAPEPVSVSPARR